MEYIFGKNTIESFIDSKSIIEVYIANNFSDEKILKRIRQSGIKVSVKDKFFLDKVSNNGKHQGIVASIKSFEYVRASFTPK
jgi:tRNA G18 (ribose-2'-O)-methylase SpoU